MNKKYFQWKSKTGESNQLQRKQMKRLLCLTVLFGMAYSVWADDKEVLVGKCTYGYITAADKKGRIAPGDPFVYFVKINDEFFAISGIAHKEDFVREKTQPLREDLPLLKISKVGSGDNKNNKHILKFIAPWTFYWIQLDSYGTVPIPLSPQEDEVTKSARFNDELSISTGKHPFTDDSYPACSYWKH